MLANAAGGPYARVAGNEFRAVRFRLAELEAREFVVARRTAWNAVGA